MSTLRVYNIENPSTAAGGIGIATDGSVTVGGLQYPTAGPLSNRNLIVNGAMNVAQRGTTSTSTGYQTVDRFQSTVVTITQTQSQETLSSGGSGDDPYVAGFRNFYRVTNTSTSSATSTLSEIQYRVEAQDIATSGWDYTDPNSYLTISFYVRSSLSGTYYNFVYAADSPSDTYYRPSGFTLVADTWKKVTISIPGASSGLTFNNDNGAGLHIYWVPHYGTNYTGSSVNLNTWELRTGDDYLPDFTQDWANSAGATFDITGVQLEVGERATPFEHRSYGDELARCQRYYQEAGTILSNNAPDRYYVNVNLPVTMRDDPAISAGAIDSGTGGALLALNSRAGANTDKTHFYQGTDNSLISNAWFIFDDEL